MRAVVLVGGQGTRLRPLTHTTPKPMLPVAGMPIIERVLAHLAGFGIDSAVLSMGYRPDAFRAAYPDGLCSGVQISYVVEEEPLDTAGAIRYAAVESGIDDTFLAVNGDVLTEWDIDDLVGFHRERGAKGTIALTPVEDTSAFGVVPTDDGGRVEMFLEKPEPGTAPTNMINAGIYVLEPSALDRIPEGRRVNIERETFPLMVRASELYALGSEAWWVDTGTPALYLGACLQVGGGTTGVGGTIEPTAVVEGSVLEPGCRIGAGARVNGSVLLADVVVDDGAVVDGSILGNRVRIGPGAVVEQLSVLGDDEVVEPGAILRGQRRPETS